MGDAVDTRVIVVALVALGNAACVGGDGPLRVEPACLARWVEIDRGGATDQDFGIWDIEIVTPSGRETCSASRGGWVCSSPTINGGAYWPQGDAQRGLPPRSKLVLRGGDDETGAASYLYTVRRNGVVRYQGPAVCEGTCGSGAGILPVGP